MSALDVAPPVASRPDVDPLRIAARDHLFGEPDALIQVVVYGDLNSRHTAEAHEAVRQAAFRHRCIRATLRYLLLDGDVVARTSAAAAEAVAPLGLYWPFVDEVFRSGADARSLRRHCRTLDVDEALVDERITLPSAAARLAEDRRLGTAAGVGSTPTTFVNGVRWRSGPTGILFGDLCRLAEVTRPLWADAPPVPGRRR